VGWVSLTLELVITAFLLNNSRIFILKLTPFGFNGYITSTYTLSPFGTLQLTHVHLLCGNPFSTFGTNLLIRVAAGLKLSRCWKAGATLLALSRLMLMISCGFEALQCFGKGLSGSHGPCLDTVLLYGWRFWVGCVPEIGFVSFKQTQHVFSAKWMRSPTTTYSLVATGPLSSGS
jgi:hypothetical protein